MSNLDQSFYIELGRILKEARLKKKYSYDTLSDKIKYIKTKSTLKRYEAGESRIEIDILEILCDTLDLDVDKTLKTARNRAAHGHSVFDVNRGVVEWTALERMLQDNGFHLSSSENNDKIIINSYNDGTLEIDKDILLNIYHDINVYIKFKMENLKQSHLNEFIKKK